MAITSPVDGSTITSDSILIIWEAENCYQPSITVTDVASAVVVASKLSMTTGTTSTVVAGLPVDGSFLEISLSYLDGNNWWCPGSSSYFMAYVEESGSDSGGGSDTGGDSDTGGYTGGDYTGVVTLAEGQTITIDSGLTVDQMSEISIYMMLTLATAFGIKQVIKAIRGY